MAVDHSFILAIAIVLVAINLFALLVWFRSALQKHKTKSIALVSEMTDRHTAEQVLLDRAKAEARALFKDGPPDYLK